MRGDTCCALLLFVLGMVFTTAEAEFLTEIRSSGFMDVDIQNPDPQTRQADYLEKIELVFPEVEGNIRYKSEGRNEKFGAYATFFQFYNNFRVWNSQMWIYARWDGKSTYAGGMYHINIDLGQEEFLENANNQQALIDYIAPFCDLNGIHYVEPIVYPIYDE